jgi:hypothetical protein
MYVRVEGVTGRYESCETAYGRSGDDQVGIVLIDDAGREPVRWGDGVNAFFFENRVLHKSRDGI